ncbi:MAG: type II methionyl aminopeptidase [Euryarchaeota archaeon]|nr:type II methionyl aminopeptidase [Euryarchaeota archaeon]
MHEADVLDKYREAGQILADVRSEAVKKVKVGHRLLDLAENIEHTIRQKGGEVAFPPNISRNEEAAHATPSKEDVSVFGKDLVKLDIGVHVDGYIADTAVTVDLGKHDTLVKAANDALDAAIDVVKAGVDIEVISVAIEEAIEGYGVLPVANLTGHGLERYTQHAPPSIPNRKIQSGVKLEEGQVVAIEPFASDGNGRVHEAGKVEIYSFVKAKPIRSPEARAILKQIEGYKTLPFAKRWLEGRVDLGLKQLELAGIIRGYPVLKDRGLVSQAEDTVIVTADGCEVITRRP